MTVTSGDKLVVRTANGGDIKIMDEINRKCLAENYSIWEWTIVMMTAPNLSRIAFCNGKPCGYIMVMKTANRTYNLTSVAVLAEYRNRGIARRLMESVMSGLPDFDVCTLHVRRSNTVAQHLYKTFGFKVTEIVKEYYNDKEDAFVMTKCGDTNATCI